MKVTGLDRMDFMRIVVVALSGLRLLGWLLKPHSDFYPCLLSGVPPYEPEIVYLLKPWVIRWWAQ
ncbi:MAG: hypothetical protein HY925_15630 [Elusimicrobia bacterium]|nr:hypothetical protein [Elusimicrobiota bacterium]